MRIKFTMGRIFLGVLTITTALVISCKLTTSESNLTSFDPQSDQTSSDRPEAWFQISSRTICFDYKLSDNFKKHLGPSVAEDGNAIRSLIVESYNKWVSYAEAHFVYDFPKKFVYNSSDCDKVDITFYFGGTLSGWGLQTDVKAGRLGVAQAVSREHKLWSRGWVWLPLQNSFDKRLDRVSIVLLHLLARVFGTPSIAGTIADPSVVSGLLREPVIIDEKSGIDQRFSLISHRGMMRGDLVRSSSKQFDLTTILFGRQFEESRFQLIQYENAEKTSKLVVLDKHAKLITELPIQFSRLSADYLSDGQEVFKRSQRKSVYHLSGYVRTGYLEYREGMVLPIILRRNQVNARDALWLVCQREGKEYLLMSSLGEAQLDEHAARCIVSKYGYGWLDVESESLPIEIVQMSTDRRLLEFRAEKLPTTDIRLLIPTGGALIETIVVSSPDSCLAQSSKSKFLAWNDNNADSSYYVDSTSLSDGELHFTLKPNGSKPNVEQLHLVIPKPIAEDCPIEVVW